MDLKKKRSVAITAGLTAVLALSPVVAPVATAFANPADGGVEQSQTSAKVVYKDSLDPDAVGNVYEGPYWYVNPVETGMFSHEGYEFAGWSYDQEGTQMVTSGASGDLMIWAQWKKVEQEAPKPGVCDVVYVDTLTGASTTTTGLSMDIWYVSDPSALNFDHEGYEFLGWTLTEEDTGLYLGANDLRDMDGQTVTVYAQWKEVEQEAPVVGKVKVTYKDALDPENPGQTMTIDSDIVYFDPQELNTFTHEGYEFVGWSYDQEGNSMFSKADRPTGDLVLWAQWREVKSLVNITYKDALDPEAIGSKSYGIDSSLWYVDPTESEMFVHPGYKFIGWSYDLEGTDMLTKDSRPAGDVIVYAQWDKVVEPETTVNVTYKDTLSDESSVSYGIPSDLWYVDPVAAGMFSHEGYEFVGWSYSQDGSDMLDASIDRPAGDVVLWAQWVEVETPETTVSITYKDALDPEAAGSKSYDVPSDLWYVNPVAAGMFSHEGYEFVGWSYSQDGSDMLNADVDRPAGDVTLWAQWEKVESPEPVVNTYDVTFDDCLASTENQVVTVNEGECVNADDVKTPECAGWKFVGWFVDTDLTVEFNFDDPVTSDMTVYAKWVEDKTSEVKPGDDAETPTTPADEATDEKADAAVPKTGDATLAVSGIAALGSALAGLGALVRRRRA